MRERILKWMPFDARLKLLIAIVGEPDRVPRKEHRRDGDIEGERRVIAAAKRACPAAAARRLVAIGRIHAGERRDFRALKGRRL